MDAKHGVGDPLPFMRFDLHWYGYDKSAAALKKNGQTKKPRQNQEWRKAIRVVFAKDKEGSFRTVVGVKPLRSFGQNEFLTFAAGRILIHGKKNFSEFFEDSTLTSWVDFGEVKPEYLLKVGETCPFDLISYLLTCSNAIL